MELLICGFLSDHMRGRDMGDHSNSWLKCRSKFKDAKKERTEVPSKYTPSSLEWDHFIIIQDGNMDIVAAHPLEAVSKDLNLTGTSEVYPVQIAVSWNTLFCITRKGDCIGKLRGSVEWKDLVLTEGTQMKFVCCGQSHVIGITNGNTAGLIVIEETSLSFRPLCPKISIKAVSCGKEHVLLLTQIGVVLSFGTGSRGQLGHGTVDNVSEPTVIEAIEGVSMINIAAGGWHSAAVSDIGDVYTWGWNESGQLGFPCQQLQKESQDKSDQAETVNVQTLPCVLDIPGTSEEVKIIDVSCGSRHTAVVTDKGLLYTWGWNEYGQLGLRDKLSRDKPTLVKDLVTHGMCARTVHCGGWTTVIEAEKVT